MNVLFISGGTSVDYQCDMLFHGLRSLFGPAAVDAERMPYMYAADFADGSQRREALYGRGFTCYGLLGSDGAVDRTDIPAKIAARFFDLVVYGSIRRCQSHLQDVLDHYPAGRVVFVDGEDDQLVATPLLGRGTYFKRELAAPGPCVAPIQFAIPAERLRPSVAEKRKLFSFIDPRDRSTYVYGSEEPYYADYAESLFGYTCKKAGWDCLRHYEIMANRCVPNFEGLEQCPAWTMVHLPKLELTEARSALLQHGVGFFERSEGRALWDRLEARIDRAMRRHLTTEALARYVVDAAGRHDPRLLLRG
ncbi:hypothetical protein [Lichenibacterium dinghuense]|uniref:hypothetical protein n=1 Tax=Lichenibacterium dinghuense TaxID=2895977 RepID=UPI001F460771|nr:hypothetical protein [Lichenibacterium sp. 6Y81]